MSKMDKIMAEDDLINKEECFNVLEEYYEEMDTKFFGEVKSIKIKETGETQYTRKYLTLVETEKNGIPHILISKITVKSELLEVVPAYKTKLFLNLEEYQSLRKLMDGEADEYEATEGNSDDMDDDVDLSQNEEELNELMFKELEDFGF